jgi:hypothetical protein
MTPNGERAYVYIHFHDLSQDKNPHPHDFYFLHNHDTQDQACISKFYRRRPVMIAQGDQRALAPEMTTTKFTLKAATRSNKITAWTAEGLHQKMLPV